MNCIVFITHNFNKEFLMRLLKIDKDVNINNYEVIVLFDNTNTYNPVIDTYFQNIKIIEINRIMTSYDKLGHSMYIHYFKLNYALIEKYKHIWIIENDVYYPNSFMEFIKKHEVYKYDLLVSEYGTRALSWHWTKTLKGFHKIRNIGVLAVIMRLSSKMLKLLIDTIDQTYFGYLEAILPHICLENKLKIHQFLPETCGILTTGRKPFLILIENDIHNNTRIYIENKIYHPIKL